LEWAYFGSFCFSRAVVDQSHAAVLGIQNASTGGVDATKAGKIPGSNPHLTEAKELLASSQPLISVRDRAKAEMGVTQQKIDALNGLVSTNFLWVAHL
jgi:hypothetical protein